MELAEHVRRQALEEVVPSAGDPVLAFARLARAVRQTVALEAKVAAGGFDTPLPVSRGKAASQSGFGPLRAKVRRAVEEAIASGAEAGDAEDLLRDLDERLDDPDYGEEMAGRPIGMIVALICGAMGVKVDLKDFTDTELGFERDDVKAAVRAYKQATLDAPAKAISDSATSPLWPPKVGTGQDLP